MNQKYDISPRVGTQQRNPNGLPRSRRYEVRAISSLSRDPELRHAPELFARVSRNVQITRDKK